MSEELCNQLKLSLVPVEIKLRASNDTPLAVLGRTAEPVQIWIEGAPDPVRFRPLVVKNLLYPLNIGARDLAAHSISLTFNQQAHTQLTIGRTVVPLCRPSSTLLTPSADPRFNRVVTLCRDAGIKPSRYICAYKCNKNISPSVNQLEEVSEPTIAAAVGTSPQSEH